MKKLPALSAFALLAACSEQSGQPVAGDEAAPDAQAVTTTDTPPSPTASASDAGPMEGTPVVEADDGTYNALPLTPGVYVLAGTTCENPSNAGWRVYNGQGLSGSATRACRSTIVKQEGDTYTIRNSCENTYDGSRTPNTVAVTIPDQVHFTLNGQQFESCPMAQVPAELRELVKP